MRIANSQEMQWAPVSGHREGRILFKRLFDGPENSPDNYELALVRVEGGYHTPRHRHNYEQVRFCLEGSIDYGQGRSVGAGQVGYFPEGTHYGPQDIVDQTALVLQCGGASGQGFMSFRQLRDGHVALAAKGRFERGVYVAPAGTEGRRKQDGYEAIWEHVNGRPLAYPPARYSEPVVMEPGSFEWRAIGPGVSARSLGRFSERGLALCFWRLAPGAALALPPEHAVRLLYVTAGAIGQGGAGTALEFASGEAAALASEAGADLFAITLPPALGLLAAA
jgi:hypothetical protein